MNLRAALPKVTLSVFLLLVLYAAAAFFAPEFQADSMRTPLAKALENTFGFPVEVGDVRYSLWPSPGLSATDLVIPDEPAFGAEPLAYVGQLQAGIAWSGLFTGRLEIASVRLNDASINLARQEKLGWNFARLLERMAAGVRRRGSAPAVELRESRINFRSGTLKSPFFLNTVDLDLDPPTAPGAALRWSYEASPARTDRSDQGFGRFSGKGRWLPAGQGRLEIDLELERSAIADVLTLVTGSDLGLQGRLLSRAFLDGPIDRLQIRGQVELENIERPTFFGLRSRNWVLPYEGSLDIPGQVLELHTVPPPKSAALPVNLALKTTRLLTSPHWDATFGLDEIPAPALLDLARRLGARIPPGLDVQGKIAGSIHYLQDQPIQGSVELRAGQVSLGRAGPVTVESAPVTFDAGEVRLATSTVHTPAGHDVLLEGEWAIDTEALGFRVKTSALDLAELRSAFTALDTLPAVPVLESCRDGRIEGSLHFEHAAPPAPGVWTGEVKASQTTCDFTGLPAPVTFSSAVLALAGPRWTLREASGVLGATSFTASARLAPGARRPLRLDLNLETLSGEQIENLLRPALLPRRGFLDRTLRRRPSAPAWLGVRHMEGSLSVASLNLAGYEFAPVRARYYWDRASIEMPDFSAAIGSGRFSGRLDVALGAELPQYSAAGRLEGMEDRGSTWDGELDLLSESLGAALSRSLRVEGSFSARNVTAGEDDLRLLHGTLDYDARRLQQPLILPSLDLWTPSEWLTGQGASGSDGKLAAELSSPRRSLRLSGTLFPLEVEAPQEAAKAR